MRRAGSFTACSSASAEAAARCPPGPWPRADEQLRLALLLSDRALRSLSVMGARCIAPAASLPAAPFVRQPAPRALRARGRVLMSSPGSLCCFPIARFARSPQGAQDASCRQPRCPQLRSVRQPAPRALRARGRVLMSRFGSLCCLPIARFVRSLECGQMHRAGGFAACSSAPCGSRHPQPTGQWPRAEEHPMKLACSTASDRALRSLSETRVNEWGM